MYYKKAYFYNEMQRQSMTSPMGLLTISLSLIALGIAGPLCTSLLFVLSSLLGLYDLNLYCKIFLAGLLLITVVLGFMGQLLCLFTPLSRGSKIKIGICLLAWGSSFATITGLQAREDEFWGGSIAFNLFSVLYHLLGGSISIIGLVAFLSFVHGLCKELASPQHARFLNFGAGMALASVPFLIAGFTALFSHTLLAIVSLCFGLLLAVLATGRYLETILSLARRTKQLRVQGLCLPLNVNVSSTPEDNTGLAPRSESGFTSFS